MPPPQWNPRVAVRRTLPPHDVSFPPVRAAPGRWGPAPAARSAPRPREAPQAAGPAVEICLRRRHGCRWLLPSLTLPTPPPRDIILKLSSITITANRVPCAETRVCFTVLITVCKSACAILHALCIGLDQSETTSHDSPAASPFFGVPCAQSQVVVAARAPAPSVRQIKSNAAFVRSFVSQQHHIASTKR